MISSSYIPHWLPPSCTVTFTFEIQNRSCGARFFLFISSTFITSIVHCDFHFWEYQNRWWAARILIMEVFFFPATRPSQGLFSRYDNSTNLIKHNHHHLHQKILVVSYSLAVFIHFHLISHHLVCISSVDIVTNGTIGDRQYDSPERKGWWLVEVEEEVEVEGGSRLDTFPGASLSRSDLCSYMNIFTLLCISSPLNKDCSMRESYELFKGSEQNSYCPTHQHSAWCCCVWPSKPLPIGITNNFTIDPTGVKLHLWHCCVRLRGLLPSHCQRELAEVLECQEDNTGVSFCFSIMKIRF